MVEPWVRTYGTIDAGLETMRAACLAGHLPRERLVLGGDLRRAYVIDAARRLPEDARAVGTGRLLPAPTAACPPAPSGSLVARVAEAERRLAVSKAWDGVENVSAAYGDYLDDLDFGPLAAIFADAQAKGWITPQLDARAAAVLFQAYTLGKIMDDISMQRVDRGAWDQMVDRTLERVFS